MAYKTKVFLEEVFESIDAGVALFEERLENAKTNNETDEINRQRGALEALDWLKKELGYGIRLL